MWSDCKILPKSKVAVETVATEGGIEVRSRKGKVGTLRSRRLGDNIRFQRGQVGVLKLQEIMKIAGRWRGWGMMTQLVIGSRSMFLCGSPQIFKIHKKQ